MEEKQEPGEIQETEEKFELTPEAATSFENISSGTGFLNRKRVLMILIIAFSTVIGGGLLFNTFRSKKVNTKGETEGDYASSPSDMLSSMRDRALRNQAMSELPPEQKEEIVRADGLPAVYFDEPAYNRYPGSVPRYQGYQEPPPDFPPYGESQIDPLLAAYKSSLIPQIQGSLFNGQVPANIQVSNTPGQNSQYGQNSAEDYYRGVLERMGNTGGGPSYINNLPPSPYNEQNAQDNKQAFYNSGAGGGSLGGGNFIPENSVWIGTIIPGILETSINTDLPGNVLARVTQNIYDSLTGKYLLIPQGTILVAKYNSSVSYAQHRVQIVWDTLIRPDGYHLELEGMNSVDKKGISGQKADYHTNWFEYLKAAGIISLFSIANARMTETAAKYAADLTASGIAQANTELVNQVGSDVISRVMNIQPTLTVDSGTLINIMLNKNIFLPPLKDFKARKYILE